MDMKELTLENGNRNVKLICNEITATEIYELNIIYEEDSLYRNFYCVSKVKICGNPVNTKGSNSLFIILDL